MHWIGKGIFSRELGIMMGRRKGNRQHDVRGRSPPDTRIGRRDITCLYSAFLKPNRGDPWSNSFSQMLSRSERRGSGNFQGVNLLYDVAMSPCQANAKLQINEDFRMMHMVNATRGARLDKMIVSWVALLNLDDRPQ